MSEEIIEISFPHSSSAEANVQSASLRDALLEQVEEIKIKRKQADPNNMDFGATLCVVLGTPAIVAIAHGIGQYIKKNGSTVYIKTKELELETVGTSDESISEMIKALKELKE